MVVRYEHSADQVLSYGGAFSADTNGNVTGTMNRTQLGATGRFENTDTFSGTFRHWDLLDIARTTDWVEYNGETGRTTAQQTWTRLPAYMINSIGMVFRAIPAGAFMMGSRISAEETWIRYGGNPDTLAHEHPLHQVIISQPFWMGVLEVTQAQWRSIMGTEPSYHAGCDSCPVENINWYQAQEFIAALNTLEGLEGEYQYRLPTEAEWEYACRAGADTAFYFGDCLSIEDENFNPHYYMDYCPNADYLQNTAPLPVGSRSPNGWNLYDMHGNVCEFVQDWYAADYYEQSPAIDPSGPASGEYRVFRGSYYGGTMEGARSAARHRAKPENSAGILGFRVVRTQ